MLPKIPLSKDHREMASNPSAITQQNPNADINSSADKKDSRSSCDIGHSLAREALDSWKDFNRKYEGDLPFLKPAKNNKT